MIAGFLIFLACTAAILGIIVGHEFGHFLAGAAVGVPLSEMKIRLLTFPPHVALRSEGRWLHPVHDFERYVSASTLLLNGRIRNGFFAAGGLLLQTFVFAAVVFASASAGVPRFWSVPIICALLALPCFYLVSDLSFTRRAKRPSGDFSALWQLCPLASFTLTTFVLAVHWGGLVYILKHA